MKDFLLLDNRVRYEEPTKDTEFIYHLSENVAGTSLKYPDLY